MATTNNAKTSRTTQTPAELARELRCDRRRIYAAIRSGALTAYWLGNGWKILPEDRRSWLEGLRRSEGAK